MHGLSRCSPRSIPPLLPLTFVGISACGDPSQPLDSDIILSTGTDGSIDTGDVPPDGLDETGGGPFVADHCLMQAEPHRFGYKYQCEGSISIDVLVEGSFDGSPVPAALDLDFGHDVDGDGYEQPRVMACCPEYDPSTPNCSQGHEQACVADLVEQGCRSMETHLRDFADDEFGKPTVADAIKRSAVHKIADHVRDHQDDCRGAFITDTGIGPTPPACDEDDNGVGYDSLLETGLWAFDPDGLVTNVEISVHAASWMGIYPLDGSAEQCESADDNDGVLFLEIDPDPESKVLHMVSGSAALHGPRLGDREIDGQSEIDSQTTGCQRRRCSRIAVVTHPTTGTASLENLELYSAGGAEVGTDDQTLTIDHFEVLLWDSTPAVLLDEGNTVTIPPGGARFAVRAAAEGMAGVIVAKNETEIRLMSTDDHWTSSSFTIAYEDQTAERWALVVTPAQWQ